MVLVISLVQESFSASARRLPDKIAVSCRGESTTFAQLEAFSNAFARRLRAAGVARGAFVPYFLSKGVHSLRATLSILKADCAYIPIDIKTPGCRRCSPSQTRCRRSVAHRKTAPPSAERISRVRCEVPVARRTMCGTTRPMKAM